MGAAGLAACSHGSQDPRVHEAHHSGENAKTRWEAGGWRVAPRKAWTGPGPSASSRGTCPQAGTTVRGEGQAGCPMTPGQVCPHPQFLWLQR